MKTSLWFLAVFLLSPMVAACDENSSHKSTHAEHGTTQNQEARGKFFKAKITSWTAGPEVSGDSIDEIKNACQIEITTPDGQVPASLSVQDIFPYMKVHGHGAPDEQITFTIEGNKVSVNRIAFTMSGPWELHIKATVNGQSEELEIPVVVP
ncbi:MAG: hypothetical protein FJY29_12505 [Betaproteobacteria bacterium]|nr:hypothetical protein [Betaproteobacteria bacterium]